MSTQVEPHTRPRVEGPREAEIFSATMEVLADVGYDRLTMDAVAQRAKASKATLYRRWNGKVSLVIDALHHHHQHQTPAVPVDTGSLRGDLIESYCGSGGLTGVAVCLADSLREGGVLRRLLIRSEVDETFRE